MERKPFGFGFDGDRYTPQQVRLEVSKDEAQWQLAGKTAKTEHLAPELPDKKQEAVCVLFSREYSANFLYRRTDKPYKKILEMNLRVGIIGVNPQADKEFRLGLFIMNKGKPPVLHSELLSISEKRLMTGLQTEKEKSEDETVMKQMQEDGMLSSLDDDCPESVLPFEEYIAMTQALPSAETMAAMLNTARELFAEEPEKETKGMSICDEK